MFSPDRLRSAIKAKGHTQESFARELGLSTRAVQKWCLGESPPSRPRLELIARSLDRDPSWFYDTDELEPAA